MNKAEDILRNGKAAKAHIATAIALIEQASGPDRTLYEGYSVGRSRRCLIDAQKLVDEANAKLAAALQPQIDRERKEA